MVSLRDWWTDKVREWAKLPPRIQPEPDFSHFEVKRQLNPRQVQVPPPRPPDAPPPPRPNRGGPDPVTSMVLMGLILHDAYGVSHGFDAGTDPAG